MAAILERQVACGGVVGSGDDGPPLLTISDAADKEVQLLTDLVLKSYIK